VVGVVHAVRHNGLDQQVAPVFYVTVSVAIQSQIQIAIRSRSDSGSVLKLARDTLGNIDPDLAIVDVRTLNERLERSLMARRTYSAAIVAFGVTALVLVVIGVYGILSYTFAQRRKEIGIGMALGADSRRITLQVMAKSTGLA